MVTLAVFATVAALFPGQAPDQQLAQQVMRPPCQHVDVGRMLDGAPSNALAEAFPGQCAIAVNWPLIRRTVGSRTAGRELACTVTVHEYGHLAGREHSDNPRSVMYPTPAQIYPPCQRMYERRGSFDLISFEQLAGATA